MSSSYSKRKTNKQLSQKLKSYKKTITNNNLKLEILKLNIQNRITSLISDIENDFTWNPDEDTKEIEKLQHLLENDVDLQKLIEKNKQNNNNKIKEKHRKQQLKITQQKKYIKNVIKQLTSIGIIYEKYDMEQWHSIENSGQRNCGIFVNRSKSQKNFILKCEYNIESLIKYKNINLLNIPFNFIPKIISFYVNNDDENKIVYYKMEKFNYDVTQFIYEKIFNVCITEYCNTKNIKINKVKLYEIFHILMPKAKNIIFIRDYIDKLFEFDYSDDSNDNKDNIKLCIQTLIDYFLPLQFTYYDYVEIIKFFTLKMDIIIKSILNQIKILQIKLFDFNIFLQDLKFDNFAIKLTQTNEKYLGENLDDNKYLNNYFYVYVIDYESGISLNMTDYTDETRQKHIKYIENSLSWSKYHQYSLQQLKINYLIDESNLNNLLKLIHKDYKTDNNNTPTQFEELLKIMLHKIE